MPVEPAANPTPLPEPVKGPDVPELRRSSRIVFIVLAVVALTWSLFTQHIWEDYWITFRASKNLATGNGLTFTPGERVHSFTSPLGTILPAICSVLVANKSDLAAMWIYRLMCIVAYAAAGALLWRVLRQVFPRPYPALFVLLLFGTDAKTIDFSINGMETSFMMLFLAWTFHAHFLARERATLQLGLAWAGLMWTRPDSCVYIAALALGVLLFQPQASFWRGRRDLIGRFLRAGLVTTAVYLPWFAWAWWYYGTPVPHTVVAKGLAMPTPTLDNVLAWMGDYPLRMFRDGGSLATTFMPAYALHTGWPDWAIQISRWASFAALVVWLFPFVRWPARVASFAFFLGQFYLHYFSNYHAPWYVPTVTLLAVVALAGLIESGMALFRPHTRPLSGPGSMRPAAWTTIALSLALPAGSAVLAGCAAWQMRLSQQICEWGHRRHIGEWLKANAATPRDTVFLECLGYIGYFSNLKMLDFPGLGSPEVVAARRANPMSGFYIEHMPGLIMYLAPDWVVLREYEAQQIRLLGRDLLTKYYTLEKVFDVKDQVNAVKFLPGRSYLLYDARFEIYRRNPNATGLRDHTPVRLIPINAKSFVENTTWAGPAYDSEGYIAAHAPSRMTVNLPEGTRQVTGAFGFFPGAYQDSQHCTRGGIFTVTLLGPNGERTVVYSALLNPRDRAQDRGDQEFSAPIPDVPGRVLEFTTEPAPGTTNAFGWTYWTNLKLEIPQPRPRP